LRDNPDVCKKLEGEVRKALNLPVRAELAAAAASAEGAAPARGKK